MKKLDIAFLLICLAVVTVFVMGGMAKVKQGASKTQVVFVK